MIDAAAVARVLEPGLGDVDVQNLRELTGGASRATWAFDAVTATGARALILRVGPPDEIHAGMELEAAALSRAAAAGAPVPHVLAASNSVAALGNPFLVCDFVPGETIVRKIQRALDDDGRATLLGQCAEALAAIHRADPTGVGLSSEDQLSSWRRELDEIGDTTATFEWAFRWLARNQPPDNGDAVLVHGDFRMGNLIVDDGRLAAGLCQVLREEGLSIRGAKRLISADRGAALRVHPLDRADLWLAQRVSLRALRQIIVFTVLFACAISSSGSGAACGSKS